MRTISYFVGIAGILFLSLSCDALKGGVTIKGKISGAENLQAFIDKTIIGKVNVDQNPGVSAQFGVRNIPTILFIKDGQVADKSVGAVPKAQLTDKLNALI